MLINTNHHYVFLCTPKAGSTSIEERLKEFCHISLSRDPKLKHINHRSFERKVKPFLEALGYEKGFKKIAMVREPIEWLYSWYRYRSRDELKNKKHPKHKNYTGGMSFNEFVDGYLSENPPPCCKISTQYNFLKDKSGKVQLDYLFKLESMKKLEKLFSGFHKDFGEMPKANVSKSKAGSKIPLSDSNREKLLSHFKEDYLMYQNAL